MTNGTANKMLSRALEHERALLDGAATEIVKTQFGSIVLNTDHLNALSHNFARVDHDVPPVELLLQLDRVFDEVGVAIPPPSLRSSTGRAVMFWTSRSATRY